MSCSGTCCRNQHAVPNRPPAPARSPTAPETRTAPASQADASQKPYRARAVRRRVWWRAHRPAYQTATALRAKRFAPEAAQIADAANRGCGKSRKRQIAEAANRGSGKSRIHPNTTEKRTATDIVSQRQKASGRQEANRVLINKNRCPQQDSSSTPTASPARRAPGPAPSPAAAQHGAYPVTPGLSGYARAIERYQRHQRHSAIFSDIQRYQRYQGHPATPGLSDPTRTGDTGDTGDRLPVPATGHPYRRYRACCADARRGAARLYHSRRCAPL